MTWERDAVHSQTRFAIKHMMMSTGKDRFTVLRGKLHIDEEQMELSWMEAEVVNSSKKAHTHFC